MTEPNTTGQKDRENTIIEFLRQAIPSHEDKSFRGALPVGIGDDAAVLHPNARTEWVVSCDSSLEGVHFLSNYPPESIGYKTLARATSDLAAMGSCPRYFLLALALPASKTRKWLRRFAVGMSRACREFGMRLIGGDTSRSSSVTICITVIGEIASGHAIPRSAARPGDLVYVTGILGAAQLGLEVMLRGMARRRDLQKLTRPHLYPRIPIKLAQSLARQRIPTAMMDVSDGLSTDLGRLCAASRVGARIYVHQLPIVKVSPSLLPRGIDSVSLALNGGEDYGLLFTANPGSANRLRHLARRMRITQIGEITREASLKLIRGDGSQSILRPKGWQPF